MANHDNTFKMALEYFGLGVAGCFLGLLILRRIMPRRMDEPTWAQFRFAGRGDLEQEDTEAEDTEAGGTSNPNVLNDPPVQAISVELQEATPVGDEAARNTTLAYATPVSVGGMESRTPPSPRA